MTALLLVAQLVSATPCVTADPGAGFVCHAGQWLPPSHPLLPPPFVASADTCTPLPNPYEDGAKAAACAVWKREQHDRPVFPAYEVGVTYVQPYLSQRMVVLCIGSSLEGIPVVTGQHIAGADVGQVFAFRVDQGRPWSRVP